MVTEQVVKYIPAVVEAGFDERFGTLMFQRQIFRRMFFSYIIIIFVCLFVYTTFILYENHIISKERMERETDIIVDEVGSILKDRLLKAQNIVLDLNYSPALKQLYLSMIADTTMNSYDLSSVISELKVKQTSSKLAVDEVIIFLEESKKAYSSSGGVLYLQDNFVTPDQDMPYFVVDTVKDYYMLKDSKRYSFGRKYLIYCDAYTYQTSKDIGVVCVLFNLDILKKDIDGILDDGYGAKIMLDGNEVFVTGDTEGAEYTSASSFMPGITVTLYAPDKMTLKENSLLIFILLVIFIISAFFIVMAYRLSRKYYQPIESIEHMVLQKTEQSPAVDKPPYPAEGEMDNIIHELSKLIGEVNGYQEKMLTITPYAKTGMLHGMLTGNMEKDSIRVLIEENFLDLIKPYFIVSVVNFAYQDPAASLERHMLNVNELFQKVCAIFSTDEIRLVFYSRNIYDVFLIANLDNDEPMDDLFYQIHKYIRETLAEDGCLITMGVDETKDDISTLKDACEGALRALDEILTNGRGEVYFNDIQTGSNLDYYFPKNFAEKLLKSLKRGQMEEISQLLMEIYHKNWDMGGTAVMYRALVDELHLSILKVIKEISNLNIMQINIEKYHSTATLEEIFKYYEAALNSIITSLKQTAEDVAENDHLEQEILEFIDDNYCNPDLSLQLLIDRFNVSSKYLSLLCKNNYGITYLQYIQNKRIKKAEELLKAGYSLKDICSICGYTNQLTFRRNFKSVTGVNPSDFD